MGGGKHRPFRPSASSYDRLRAGLSSPPRDATSGHFAAACDWLGVAATRTTGGQKDSGRHDDCLDRKGGTADDVRPGCDDAAFAGLLRDGQVPPIPTQALHVAIAVRAGRPCALRREGGLRRSAPSASDRVALTGRGDPALPPPRSVARVTPSPRSFPFDATLGSVKVA